MKRVHMMILHTGGFEIFKYVNSCKDIFKTVFRKKNVEKNYYAV